MKNFYIRTISGIIFTAIMVISILWSDISYVILSLFVIQILTSEYLIMTTTNQLKRERVLTVLTSISLFLLSTLVAKGSIEPKWILLTILPFISILVSLLYSREKGNYQDFSLMLSSILYIALPFSLISLIVFDNGIYDGKLLLSLFILLWVSDVGAYVFGMLFGRNSKKKLFPSISPKKSWIGFWGGLFTTILASYILNITGLIDFELYYTIVLGIIINIFGVLGDLVESQLKRNFGAKDSGTIMPGHGGLLDRFDGVLISFPIAILFIKLFLS